jgi:hypothetical protein
LAPVPLSYTLQVTSMRLPLSTIAASSWKKWSVLDLHFLFLVGWYY